MKRFLVFKIPADTTHEGGWDHFWTWANSLESAIAMINEQATDSHKATYQIVDLNRGIVAKEIQID